MRVPFSEMPGRHERHLRRKLDNPLFPGPLRKCSDPDLREAQRRDHEELIAFLADLRDLVQRAVDLRPNEETQRVLDLKGELDRAYERASFLADDQAGNKDAIRTLVAVIMATIRAAAAGDPVAEQELEGEEEARRIHFRLLRYPLVADLLDPGSVIRPDELASTLLSESGDAVAAAIELFDADQLTLLCQDARRLLAGCGRLPETAAGAPARLVQMEQRLASLLRSGGRDAGRG